MDQKVAVKAIRLQFFTAEVFRRELGIWKRLRHCNILKFMGTTSDFGPSMALVAPWIANGTLTSFINQHNETLALRDRLLLLRDIAAGLNYLHAFSFTVDGQVYFNPVVHGDLTGTNVLVGSDGTAYLADFGLSGTLTKLPGMTYLVKMTCHPGAMRWSAPELLSGEDSTSAITTQSDIYSLGNIMLQVLTGSVPWQHLTNDAAILLKVIGGEIHPRPEDSCVTDQCWDFMTRCWSMAAIDRPSAEEALEFLDRELILPQSSDGGPVVDTSLSNDHPSPSPAHFSSPSSSFVRSGCPSPSSTRYMCTALLAGTPDMFHDPVPMPLDADLLEWAKIMADPLWQDTLVPGFQWLDQPVLS
ncbi:kinase-like domain-containing protein [Suillus ampliporus]|nr:kinase-like domain-containing protein [Suillus ampliporus]